MIPEIYFEDPFPINIPMDDLSDCYITENPKDHIPELINSWGEVSLEGVLEGNMTSKKIDELKKIYVKMTYTYMNANFYKKGLFAVIHDASNIVKAVMENGSVNMFFKEYGIDLSHLYHFSKQDLQIIIVPFNNIEDLLEMTNTIKALNAIDIWDNTEFVEYKNIEEEEEESENEGF